jgi:hypothetical protein
MASDVFLEAIKAARLREIETAIYRQGEAEYEGWPIYRMGDQAPITFLVAGREFKTVADAVAAIDKIGPIAPPQDAGSS